MPQIISNESTFTAMFYDHEIDFYREFGRRRYNRMRAVGAVDRLYAKHLDRIENDLLGLLGEAAVAELLGVPMNLTESDCGDGGIYDLTINQQTVQVKTSWHNHGGLVFPNRFKCRADVAVLCVTNKKLQGLVKVVGWVTREEYRANAVDRDLGMGVCAYLDQYSLRPIQSLLGYLTGGRNESFN
jgi:hypothetical protein